MKVWHAGTREVGDLGVSSADIVIVKGGLISSKSAYGSQHNNLLPINWSLS